VTRHKFIVNDFSPQVHQVFIELLHA